MRAKVKHIICLALAALLLFAFAACGKNGGNSGESKVKKDQIVHVGETVQYGRLKFKFVDYETDNRNNEIEITITLDCEKISGDNEEYVFAHNFVFYEDGKLIGEGAGIEKDGMGYYLDKEIYPDRGPVEMSIRQFSSASASRIEIDYRDSDYTREWGKLTFVVDLP
jgi:hypothetical protein